jgi:hypothetical protein
VNELKYTRVGKTTIDGKQMKEGQMGRACSTHRLDWKCIQNFDRKTSNKKSIVWEMKALIDG